MYIPGDQPEALDALLDHYHRLCQSKPAMPKGVEVPLLPGRAIDDLAAGCTLEVQNGVVNLNYQDRIALILQPGDLFSVPESVAWPVTLQSEESGLMRLVTPDELTRALDDTSWAHFYTRLLTTQNQALTLAFAACNRHGVRPTAGFRRLNAGSVIIRETMPSEEVFTLMRGSARVELRGHVVGRIEEGEIFGVLSALTESSHMATVIAESDVTLMSVPSDEFISLIQAQPETFMRLLRTLSRHIGDLNNQLVTALENPGNVRGTVS